MAASTYGDQTRNLNPTPAARIAMIIWGNEYAQQSGGSMDFWDALSDSRKRRCEKAARAVRAGEIERLQRCLEAVTTFDQVAHCHAAARAGLAGMDAIKKERE